MKDRLKLLLLPSVISVCASILSVATYHHFFAVKIVAADTTEFLQQIRSDYLDNKITPKELEQKIEQVIAAIRQQPANKIILSSDVVLSKNVEIIKP
jgi:isochorismate synthase EntC